MNIYVFFHLINYPNREPKQPRAKNSNYKILPENIRRLTSSYDHSNICCKNSTLGQKTTPLILGVAIKTWLRTLKQKLLVTKQRQNVLIGNIGIQVSFNCCIVTFRISLGLS